MNIKIVKKESPITLTEIQEIAKEFYVLMLKGAVDIEKEIIALGGEYHLDANNLLTEHDCEQKDIWGFNLLLTKPKDEWLEYTSLINIRPNVGNRSMFIEDENIRAKIKKIINQAVTI